MNGNPEEISSFVNWGCWYDNNGYRNFGGGIISANNWQDYGPYGLNLGGQIGTVNPGAMDECIILAQQNGFNTAYLQYSNQC